MPSRNCESASSPAALTASSITASSSDSLSLASTSGSGKGHLRHEKGRGIDGAAKFQVVRRLELAEHRPEVRGNGDLAHRIGDGAVLDPEAGGAAAVIAGDAVDAHADELGHQKPAPHVAEQRLGAAAGGRESDIGRLRRGRSGGAAAGMAGAGQAELAGGMLVEQPADEAALGNDRGGAGCPALGVERLRGKAATNGGVVD